MIKIFFRETVLHHRPADGCWLSPAVVFTSLLILLAWAQTVSAQAVEESVSITVVPLEQLLFHPVREAPARVVSLNDATISAEIAGKVEEVSRRPGDDVSEGDTLARLDCSTYEIARKRSEAALQAARARFKYASQRLKDAEKLIKARNISSDEFNQRSSEFNRLAAELNVHQADLEEAKWRQSRCVILAPFDAVVVERRASRGDYATPGSPIVRLVDLDSLEVSAQIQQQDLEEMKRARRLEFMLERRRFPLRLRAIVPLLEGRIRSYEVRYTFEKQAAPPGAAGRLLWESESPHVPARFLVQRDGRLGLFLLREERARFHPLDGAVQGLPAVVDLPPETLIIDAGRFSVEDGSVVKVVDP